MPCNNTHRTLAALHITRLMRDSKKPSGYFFLHKTPWHHKDQSATTELLKHPAIIKISQQQQSY